MVAAYRLPTAAADRPPTGVGSATPEERGQPEEMTGTRSSASIFGAWLMGTAGCQREVP